MATEVAAGFGWVDGPAGRCLQNGRLSSVSPHRFTTRQLQFRAVSFETDEGRLAAAFDVEPAQLVWVRQVHGRAVLRIDPTSVVDGRPEADAIVSTDPARVIAVRVADCVPVLLADRTGKAVAAVHAGWRGVAAGVVHAAVSALGEFGIPADDLVVAVGPSIGPCCYQVDERVRTAFLGVTPDAAAWFTEDGPGHWRLDLWQAVTDQLASCGIPAGEVDVARLCTADNLEDCFSYRKEGADTGRLVAAIRRAP